MKKFILSILLLFTVATYSQNTQISLMQDIKLATMQDSYGNKPFTTDIIIKVKQKWDSQAFAGFSFEYANLQENYYRFSQLFGYDIKLRKFHIQPEISFGIIKHTNWYVDAFGCGMDISYEVGNNWLVGAYYEAVIRTDINKVRGSFYFGITKMF